MARKRVDTAPQFNVGEDSVLIQQVPGSTAPLLDIKDHTGSSLMTVASTGAMTTSAPMTSPELSGTPTAPTAAAGTNTTQIATTEFVRTEVSNLVASAPAALDTLDELAAALGDDANFATTTATAIGLKAPIDSPAFTGTPTAPTASTELSNTQLATTEFVKQIAALFTPSGSVISYAGASAPTGWLLCSGQTVSRTTYSSLFAAIGTTYGSGDGSTTFALPDLRGRVIAGVDNMGGSAASRLTSGVSGVDGAVLGAVGGNENPQLHTHTITGGAHTHQVRGGSVYSANSTGDSFARSNTTGDVNFRSGFEATGSGYGSSMATHTHSAANYGTGTAGNVQPTIVLNYIIKV
jgi:microcystin-dependent protein